MKYLKRFNEADVFDPHAWRNKPAEEKETNMLDIVRGGDIEALESFLKANSDKMNKLVTQAIKFSAPGTRNENPAIYKYVMDNYSDLVDMRDVAKWLKYDKDYIASKNGRDIDEHGNDWYGFDHPEDLG